MVEPRVVHGIVHNAGSCSFRRVEMSGWPDIPETCLDTWPVPATSVTPAQDIRLQIDLREALDAQQLS
jgi:hypothetical protein